MTESNYSISLKELLNEFRFEEIYLPAPAEDILIRNPEVDRPGLALSGFYEIFESKEGNRQYEEWLKEE